MFDLKVHRRKVHKKRGHLKRKTEKKENKEIVCAECGKVCNSRAHYRQHLVIHSDSEFVCEICSHVSKTIGSLSKHRDIHSTEQIPCKDCGKIFKSAYNLYRHSLNLHTTNSERKYQCDKCEKGFLIKQIYEDHLNIHRGIKPYSCDICDTKFGNLSNKLHHIKYVHGSSKRSKNATRPTSTNTSSSTSSSDVQPTPVVCKKRKGSCSHEIVSGKHYNTLAWTQFADSNDSKISTDEVC